MTGTKQNSMDITESGQQGNPKNSLKREREHMHECTTIVRVRSITTLLA